MYLEERFIPENVLEYMSFHKMMAKKRPPQTLFWHSLNTFYASKTISEILPKKLTSSQKRVLLWAALLHDIGKGEKGWQNRKEGAHMISTSAESQVRDILKKTELVQGYAPNNEEIDLIVELIREHHTRKSLSYPDMELLLSILKLADTLVSADMIDYSLINEVRRFSSGYYKPIVLTAEEHPISPYALSLADQYVVTEVRGTLLITNSYQSMYLIKEDVDIEKFKRGVLNYVSKRINSENSTGLKKGSLFKKISSWVSEGPIRDKHAFFYAVHRMTNQVISEIRDNIKSTEQRLERRRDKGYVVDEREVWFGPYRVLHHATQLYMDKPKTLLGTNIDFGGSGIRKDSNYKSRPYEVAKELGCDTPYDFAIKVLELIKKSTVLQDENVVDIDIFTWSDEEFNVSSKAMQAYQFYRNTQWNSKERIRNTDNYCFSCKRREAKRDAPTDPNNINKTDTWTSAAVKKGKVKVCELCFLTYAYILPRIESGRFNIIATPAYNQARIDWNAIFWGDLKSPDFSNYEIRSHRIVFPLRKSDRKMADSPNDALMAAIGSTLEFEAGSKSEYLSYIDFLYRYGLLGTIGSGPQHPTPYVLSGMGIRIKAEEWERYGKMVRLLAKTSPQKTFPVVTSWNKLTKSKWGWGSLLAIRHKRGKINKFVTKEIEEWIKMVENEGDKSVLKRARKIHLYTADRDERFKSAESILRRMEGASRRVEKGIKLLGIDEPEIVEHIAQIGKKQLRARVIKNSSDGKWEISNDALSEVDDALRAVASEIWRLRNNHALRQDFINAVTMVMAYSPRERRE